MERRGERDAEGGKLRSCRGGWGRTVPPTGVPLALLRGETPDARRPPFSIRGGGVVGEPSPVNLKGVKGQGRISGGL